MNTNETNVSLNDLINTAVDKTLNKIDKTKSGNMVHSTTRSDDDYLSSWQSRFIARIEDMVSSFLDFPDTIPKDFQDKQFARHLLWRIGDNKKAFKLIMMKGAYAASFDFLFKRLMPYITGELPEEVSSIDNRYMKLSINLFEIIQDYVILHESNFEELMTRIVHAINVARYVK